MWNKFQHRGINYYSTDTKDKFCEYILGDFEKINANPDKYRLYNIGGYSQGFYKEELKSEFEMLPSGIYRLIIRNYESFLEEYKLSQNQTIIDLQFIKDIQDDFSNFINSKSISDRLHIVHKRGILLYGPPGTGKTTTIHKILTGILPTESLVIFIDKELTNDYIEAFRDDRRLKILVFEELTEACDGSKSLTGLLNFLDGENSLHNSFIIGTTNYPEKLPTNVIDRPGRFDRLYKIDYLNLESIIKYSEYILERKLEINEIEVFKLETKLTIAYLKEILLSYLRNYKLSSIIDALKIINDQRELAKSKFKDVKKEGYSNDIL